MNIAEKEEMDVVKIFKHKDDYYMMLLDSRCNKYYLKIVNNTLCNITIDEYLDITKTYYSPQIYYGYKKVNIEPLIRYKNKLIAMGTAVGIMASMAGCAPLQEKTENGLSAIGIEVEDLADSNDLYRISKINLGDKLKYGNMTFENFVNCQYDKHCTPGEYGEIIGITNVTFDDLREAVKENADIPDNIKNILYKGIDNLQLSDFKMDYSTLYYNLQRLKTVYVNKNVIDGNAGIYDHISGVAKLDNALIDNPDFAYTIIIHEILGHGSTRSYNPDKKVMCDVSECCLYMDSLGSLYSSHPLGQFGVEGIADIITSLATQEKITTETAGYTTEVYSVVTLCSSLGISLEEYANNGIDYLINEMYKNGIENPYKYIITMDEVSLSMINNQLIQADNTQLFIEYYDELYKNGKTQDELAESSEEYKPYVEEYTVNEVPLLMKYKGLTEFDVIIPAIVTDHVQNDLEKLKTN